AWTSALSISDSVFCENCNVWCLEKDGIMRFSDPTPPQVEALKAGKIATLGELAAVDAGTTVPYISINTRRCESCNQTESIQIKRVTFSKNDKGEMTPDLKNLTQPMLLDAAALGELQNALMPKKAEAIGEATQS